jgi:hypothetical protein
MKMNRQKLPSPVLEVTNNYYAAVKREVTEGIKETTAECPRAISEDGARADTWNPPVMEW